jgi:hypothetical protein
LITPASTARTCERLRCNAEVFDALEVAVGAGMHKKVVLDVEPTTWAGGARHRLSTQQPPDAHEVHVVLVRNSIAAFGLRAMYRRHAESCAGGSGVKTRSKEAA